MSSSLTHVGVPYPAIERHGIIGDRRTAALVAADGTIDWLCLPDYDGDIIFGSLLDHARGGGWRVGPANLSHGDQRYDDGRAALVTTWTVGAAHVELTDMMAWPENERTGDRADRRVVIRRLRCHGGSAACEFAFRPACDFSPLSATASAGVDGQITFKLGSNALRLWTSRGNGVMHRDDGGVSSRFELRDGEVLWCVLDCGEGSVAWSAERAADVMAQTQRYWQEWSNRLPYFRPRARQVRRSAMLVHLLSYAPAGSLVAAPTTSLPERIGGDGNHDYRFAWIRDASLSLAILAMLGDTKSAQRYMDWLKDLGSSTDAPLQIVYGIRGELELTQRERHDLAGYRGSKTIRYGNHAFSQRQHDALGYLADCVDIYLQQGGEWRDEYRALVRRAADHTVTQWRLPDNGIWELGEQQHFVSGKVMSWIALQRAVRIARKLEKNEPIARWESSMREIHDDVMTHGWSERQGAFKQRYEAENLDASALLIPVMGFLPTDHPRVRSTIDAIAGRLTIDGLVYRFDPQESLGSQLPMGEAEGAFLPCTFWLATAYAKLGRTSAAEAIISRVEKIAGALMLMAEEADPRTNMFLGNTPLLFSQIEYVRAVTELAKARPLSMAMLGASMAATYARRTISRWIGKDR